MHWRAKPERPTKQVHRGETVVGLLIKCRLNFSRVVDYAAQSHDLVAKGERAGREGAEAPFIRSQGDFGRPCHDP
jgi:hypothetical protein